MLQVEVTSPDGQVRLVQVPPDCTIGKATECAIRLDSWRIGKEHARLFSTPAGVLVDDLGAFGGVLVNGDRIEAQFGPLTPGDVVGIGPFKLRVVQLGVPGGPVQAAHPASQSSSALPNENCSSASRNLPVPATTPYRRPPVRRRENTSNTQRRCAAPLRSAASTMVSS